MCSVLQVTLRLLGPKLVYFATQTKNIHRTIPLSVSLTQQYTSSDSTENLVCSVCQALRARCIKEDIFPSGCPSEGFFLPIQLCTAFSAHNFTTQDFTALHSTYYRFSTHVDLTSQQRSQAHCRQHGSKGQAFHLHLREGIDLQLWCSSLRG